MIEQDHAFSCPYCGVELSIRLDPSGGTQQNFIQDCEVCCRPIQLTVRFEGEDVSEFSSDAID